MGRPGGAAVASAGGAARTAATAAEGAAPEVASAERVAARATTSEPGPVTGGATAGRSGPGDFGSAGDILMAASAIVGLPAVTAAGYWIGGSLLETPGETATRRAKDPGRMAMLKWSLEQRSNPADMPADQRQELEAMIGPWTFKGEDAPMPPGVRRYLEQNRGAPEIDNLLSQYDRSGRRKRPPLP